MANTTVNKHTPGPWVFVPRNRSSLRHVPDDAWAIMHLNKNSDDPCDLGIIEGHENNEANARLIAAAPELLAACEALEDLDEDPAGWDAYCAKVRAAVLKAKGEICLK